MATISVQGQDLVVEMNGLDKLWSLKSKLTIPLAHVRGATVDPGTLFTDDVVGWSPIATVSGLTDVADLAAVRDNAFSGVVIMFRGLDEVGNKALAEWIIEADHTGPFVLGEGAVVNATGRRVQLAGVDLPQRHRPEGRGDV